MANGTLSSYFEKQKDKGVKTEGVSPYSASVEPTGGSAPSGGGPAGGPSAPKAAPAKSAGGGTGFVSFGQYFGANAPAVQQQAEKQAVSAKGFGELNALQQPGGMQGSAFDQLLGGGVTQREAAKQGQYQFKQLGQRLADTQAQTPQETQALTEAQRYNAYLQQGGSGKTYDQLSEDDKRWVRAAVDGTSFV